MKAKKLLALLMSLVLLLGALAVPALAADDGTTGDSAAAGSSEAASDAASDAAAAAQEAYTKIMEQLDAASKKYDGDTVVATVNGTEVTWKLCYYLIASMTSQFIRYTMAIPDFTTDTGDGTTLQDAMREALEARMKYYTVPAAEADKRGLAETVDAEVETQWNSIVEQYGGVDALMEAMESAYLDEPTYRLLLRSNAAFNAIMEDTYGANGEKLSEADVLAWANDNNYVRCKHILFLTKNDDGTDMTDEEKAEVRKEAETTLEELRALESDRETMMARFDELMAEADDPGMTNFPDGYIFTDDQMVQEFEDGARALADYEISDIVESSYGYHIILRLPLDPDGKTLSQDSGTGDYMTLRADAANELFNNMLIDWINNAEVEWKGDFGTMDYNELFEEPAAKSANVWMYVAIAALVVIVALAAVLLGRKKPAETEETETSETAEVTTDETEKAETVEKTETEDVPETEPEKAATETEAPAEAEPEAGEQSEKTDDQQDGRALMMDKKTGMSISVPVRKLSEPKRESTLSPEAEAKFREAWNNVKNRIYSDQETKKEEDE